MSIEKIRSRYRPDQVRVLFVGESPPTGGEFFYFGNSQMFKHVRRILGQRLFEDTSDFLANFKEAGCYLDDLVLNPCKPSAEFRRKWIPGLADRIVEYRPLLVVALLKRIGDDVQEAVVQSGLQVCPSVTHFPGNGQQGKFEHDIDGLLPVLRKALLPHKC